MQCQVCNSKIGLFENVYTDKVIQEPITMCGNCSKKLNDLKAGDKNVVPFWTSSLNNLADERIKGEIQELINEFDGIPSPSKARIANVETEDNRKQQYESKFRQNVSTVKTSTSNYFAGYDIADYKGVISTSIVQGTNIITELGAAITDFAGGRSRGFEENLKFALKKAL